MLVHSKHKPNIKILLWSSTRTSFIDLQMGTEQCAISCAQTIFFAKQQQNPFSLRTISVEIGLILLDIMK